MSMVLKRGSGKQATTVDEYLAECRGLHNAYNIAARIEFQTIGDCGFAILFNESESIIAVYQRVDSAWHQIPPHDFFNTELFDFAIDAQEALDTARCNYLDDICETVADSLKHQIQEKFGNGPLADFVAGCANVFVGGVSIE